MIPILYEYNEMSFSTNGLGRLRDCISCVVTEERNGIYECEFTYPVDGVHFADIYPGRIIGVTHDDSNDMQPFDIIGYSRPIDGIVTFQAVHISYRQGKLVASGTNINSLADAFTMLGTSQPTNKFSYSADFTSNAYMAAGDGIPRSVRAMLGGTEGSILDTYGGEYEWDRFRVILHKNRGVERNSVIRYGVNLIDYNEDTDYSGVYSAAVPYWIGDYNGKQTVVVGNRVQSGLATVTHRGETVALDLSEKFETKPTKTQLQNWAKNHMLGNYTNMPAQSIEINFLRLQDSPEFEQYAALMQYRLCDSIKLYFSKYNVMGTFKIVKTEYDVLQERFVSMELGTLSTSLAEALGVDNQSQSGFSSGNYVDQANPFLEINTSASPGTTDGDLYAAINGEGWASDIIADDLINLKQLLTKQITTTPGVRFAGAAGVTKTLSVPNNSSGFIVASGGHANNENLYIYNVSTAGAVTLKAMGSSSNITTSTSTRTITLTGASYATRYIAITFYGGVPTVS